MPIKAILDEQVMVKERDRTEEGSHSWTESTGNPIRAYIRPTSAQTALKESSRLNTKITHEAIVEASDEFIAGKIVVRLRDGANFRIEHVSETGKRRHGGRRGFLRLLLWRIRPEIQDV